MNLLHLRVRPNQPSPLASGHRRMHWLLLLAVLSTYLVFLPSPGTHDVTDCWLRWTKNVREYGIVSGYKLSSSDYPPGWFLLSILLAPKGDSSLTDFELLKVILAISALIGGIVYVCWCKRILDAALLMSATALSSVALGYLDVLYLAPLLVAFWSMKHGHLLLCSFSFSIAVLLKWQPVILLPFFLSHSLGVQRAAVLGGTARLVCARKVLLGAALPIVLAIIMVDPADIARAFKTAISHHALSLNALNVGWIIQLIIRVASGGPLSHYYEVAAPAGLLLSLKCFFFIIYTFVLFAFMLRARSFEEFVWFCGTGYFTYFLFNIGVHENHLFIGMITAFVLVTINRAKWGEVALFAGVMANLNLFLFYGINGESIMTGRLMAAATLLLSGINIIYGMGCLHAVLTIARTDLSHSKVITS